MTGRLVRPALSTAVIKRYRQGLIALRHEAAQDRKGSGGARTRPPGDQTTAVSIGLTTGGGV
ncbi:hypothetical protein JY586_19050, partial [Pseudomonas aeruginosa]|nr:hypothetical protein [Pseudomonas aeruginosa]